MDKTTACQTIQPQTVADVMQCGVVTISQDASVYGAVGIMAQKHISGLPVTCEGKLVGIISEKDLLKLLYSTEFVPGKVRDYMSTDVVSFDIDDSVAEICACLTSRPFRRVPILCDGRLAGVISRADLIKAKVAQLRSQKTAGGSSGGEKKVLARDVMRSGLLTTRKNTPVWLAMETLAARGITGLPVVDDGMRLLGIISEKDLLKVLHVPDLECGKVEDLMTTDVVTFNHDDSLFDVCDCLVANNFRRVPILDQGRLVGVISRADIMLYILKNKSTVFKLKQTHVN